MYGEKSHVKRRHASRIIEASFFPLGSENDLIINYGMFLGHISIWVATQNTLVESRLHSVRGPETLPIHRFLGYICLLLY